jgi:hypothetical protein
MFVQHARETLNQIPRSFLGNVYNESMTGDAS